MVQKCWVENHFQGCKAFILKEKLKLLKSDLKKWNKEVFDNIDTKIQILEKEISELDVEAELVRLSDGGVELRRKKFAELRKGLNDKHSLIR